VIPLLLVRLVVVVAARAANSRIPAHGTTARGSTSLLPHDFSCAGRDSQKMIEAISRWVNDDVILELI
jgi:hypothetical protein